MSETLGASFSIDITNLRAGLTQANRLIRESESEFKAAAAGMDDWSDSEAGLNAKIKSLTSVTELQRAKVDALQQEYDRLIEDGLDPMSAEAIKLRTQINNETAALNKNEAELRRQKDALEDVADGSKRTSIAIEAASRAAEKADGGFTVLKGALANLVADGFRKAIDAAKEFATSMITVAAEVKASNSQFTQTFGELEGQATESIKNIADSTGILETRLKSTGAGIYAFARSSGADTKDAMELMQEALLATADSAAYYDKSLEESAETLQSFLKGNFANDAALGVSATEFTRNAKAAELFGKKYNDLSEIEKQKTLLKMVTDSQKLSGAFGQAARESDGFENVMGNVNETMKQFKAKVGTPVLEALIPVIQDATKSFQEFSNSVDWKAYGKKATEAIKDIIKKGKELGKQTLPMIKAALKVSGSALTFVTDNFKALATGVGIAVVALNGFKAAMAVTTAVTAAKTAVAGLNGAVGLATKAQTIWNAVMAANPIGAVITGVGLLAAGIAVLVATQKNATSASKVRNQVAQETLDKQKEEIKSFQELKSAQEEQASADLVHIANAERLGKELNGLVDANGNVTEANKGRVAYILGELNNALGTEYTLTGNQIEGYQELQAEIWKTIDAKKAEIMLNASLPVYEEALINYQKAQLDSAVIAQQVADQLAVIDEARANVQAAQMRADEETDARKRQMYRGQVDGYQEVVQQEEAALAMLQGAYSSNEQELAGYYDTISTYEQASALLMEGNTAAAIALLDNKNSAFQSAADVAGKSADEQKEILEQQVIDTEINAQLMRERYEAGVEGVTEDMVKTAEEQAEQAKVEFAKIGGNITQGIADGAGNKSWVLNSAMTKVINDALAAARKAADSHSPSRKFERKVGITLPQGVARGVAKGTRYVVDAVKEQIGVIQDSYDLSGISESVNVGFTAKTNKSNAKDTPVAGAGGVVVYQTNNYSQAHSRYELYKSKQQTAAAVRLAMAGV